MRTVRPSLFALVLAIGACSPTPSEDVDAGTMSDVPGLDVPGLDAPGSDTPGADAPRIDADLPPPTSTPVPMPRINHDVPAFSASGEADASTDEEPTSCWAPSSLPASITFDVSAGHRSEALYVAWYAIHAAAWFSDPTNPDEQFPTAYTIEVHTGPSAATPPATGWTEVVSVRDNGHAMRGLLTVAPGANWVRMTVTESSGGSTPCIDVDVHDAPSGASDAFLFMGDSITWMTFPYAFSDFRNVTSAAEPGRWPVIFDAAIGGTNTGTALEVIDETMADFEGNYVVLAYGTNDHADDFHMAELVDHVLASGRIPVVPHMIWAEGADEGPSINAQIDAIYAAHPEVLRGPDLWAAFEGRTDLIPAGDVHPNDEGGAHLRQTWADWLLALPRP